MGRDLPARRTVFNGPKTVKNGRVTRDARGRFMAGAPPGPGRPRNPYARAQAQLRCAVLDQVTERDLRAVVRQVLHLAKRGNLAAVEQLFRWIIGPPPVPTHPDFIDAHELQVRRALPTLVDMMALADEQADRAPTAADDAEEDLDDAAQDEALPPVHFQLQAVLSWAVQQLAEAQKPAALPPPPDPKDSWALFAAHHVEWDTAAAVPTDLLYVTYARWAAARGEPVLAEDRVLAWLAERGATITTGTFSQLTAVQGIRVTE